MEIIITAKRTTSKIINPLTAVVLCSYTFGQKVHCTETEAQAAKSPKCAIDGSIFCPLYKFAINLVKSTHVVIVPFALSTATVPAHYVVALSTGEMSFM